MLLAGEDVAGDLCVRLGRAAAQVIHRAQGQTIFGRVEFIRRQLAVADFADLVPADEACLVHTAAADHHAARYAEVTQHLRHWHDEAFIVHAEQLHSRARRIGQRAEHVEDGALAHALTDRRDILHGLMIALCEQEADARFSQHPFVLLGRERQDNAQLLEHVSRARLGRNRPVAVLCYRHTARRRHECGSRGDVERADLIAARAYDVHNRAFRLDVRALFAHDLGAGRDLSDGFALHAERRQQGCHFDVGRGAVHHFLHCCTSDGIVQISAVDGLVNCKLNHLYRPLYTSIIYC